jgi:pilus assembly protein Flp/PilA
MRRTKRERGQGMTEYIIIVALVAIGAIAVVTIFGDNIRALFGASANALAGQSTQQVGTKTIDDTDRNIKDFAAESP